MTTVAMTSGRGPYRNGVRRREQIVQSASEVFAELGYVGGSIRTIADRVGASPATLLQHFGSKEGLLAAVLDDWKLQTEAATELTTLKGLAYFRSLSELMTFHVEHRGLLELFLTMAAEATHPDHPAREFIQGWRTSTYRNWSEQLRLAIALEEVPAMTEAEIAAQIYILTAVADGLELQWLIDPTIDLVGVFVVHLEQMIEGWQKAGA